DVVRAARGCLAALPLEAMALRYDAGVPAERKARVRVCAAHVDVDAIAIGRRVVLADPELSDRVAQLGLAVDPRIERRAGGGGVDREVVTRRRRSDERRRVVDATAERKLREALQEVVV